MSVLTQIICCVIFQVILEACGFVVPLNAGTLDYLNNQQENQYPEDISQNINLYNSIEQETCKSFPRILNLPVPNIDNSFKLVLSYGEECAMKYKQYSMQACLGSESTRTLPPNFVEPCLPNDIVPSLILPTYEEPPTNRVTKSPTLLDMESCLSVKEISRTGFLPTVESYLPNDIAKPISKSVTPGFRAPLQVTSSIITLDPSCYKDLNKASLSTSLPQASSSFEPLTTRSNIDLSRSVEMELTSTPELLSLPISGIPLASIPLIEPNTPLSRSILTLPLSVTSTTKDIKTVSDWSTTNIPYIPYKSTGKELYVPTPNALPYPSLPLYNEINSAAFPIENIPDSMKYQYICPSLIDSDLNNNCPLVPTSAQKLPICFSYRGFYQGTTDLPSLTSILTSSLYRNCHTLKPIQVFANSLPFQPTDCLSALNSACLPMIDDLSYKTSCIFDSYPSSSMNSLSLTPSESISLLPLPNMSLKSNSLYDDFPKSTSEVYSNSYKRNVEVTEHENTSEHPFSNNTVAEPSISKECTTSNDNNYVTILQQIITVIEMLIDDKVEKSNLKDILSLLPDF